MRAVSASLGALFALAGAGGAAAALLASSMFVLAALGHGSVTLLVPAAEPPCLRDDAAVGRSAGVGPRPAGDRSHMTCRER
ncbi:hypothetical protein ABZ471_26005 [Streptomyces sp. NPDC005728]|uniref:hypothetical protein n=1 Tax=Streptomyces sp. NPDC005728 TaxID=3157054 RepID=UPI0033E30E59